MSGLMQTLIEPTEQVSKLSLVIMMITKMVILSYFHNDNDYFQDGHGHGADDMTNKEQLVWYVDVFHASESKQAQCTGRGMYLDVNMTILPLLFPRQFFPGGRKRLFYCILDDKICEKL